MRSLQNFVASISLLLIATRTIRSTPSSGNDWLHNIPVKDLLTSGKGLNASEKIQEKIINTVTQYASDCPTHKKILIDLSAKGFQFPKDKIEVDLGSDTATFYDIRISELSNTKRKSYSTSIKCQSTRMAKIDVKVLEDLEISADLNVGKHANFTSESEAEIHTLFYGSISLILKDISISKQIAIQANDEENIKWKIFHSKLVVSVDIAPEFQIPIINKMQAVLDEVEPPLRRFLIEKFNVEFTKSGISVADVCSKFIKNADENSKKFILKYRNNNLLDLYLIPKSDMQWGTDAHFLSAGPIIIDGMSSFNNTELIVSENTTLSSDGVGYYFFTTPAYDDPEIKDITVKIQTNGLKGKMDYNYNSELLSINFTFDFIEFEVKKRNTYQYESKNGNHTYDKSGKQHFYPSSSYARSSTNNADIQVRLNLGKMQAKVLNVSVIKGNRTRRHAAFVLSATLYHHIRYSLTNSLKEKLLNESLFENCP